VFGDIDPRTITPEDLQALRGVVARTVSESEAFRTIKVWRALWKKMAVMGCCDRDNDPSLVFANLAPRPRQEIWARRRLQGCFVLSCMHLSLILVVGEFWCARKQRIR
jgi:hypothetical protein